MRMSILLLLFNVAVDNKLIEAMRKVLYAIVITLAKINEMVTITHCTIILVHSDKGYQINLSKAITNAS